LADENSVTMSKDMLYGIVIAVLAGLLVLSIFTSGFGIVKPVATNNPPSGNNTVVTPPANNTGNPPSNGTVAPATIPTMTIKAGSIPPTGQASAPVSVVVISDFQCPYCERLYSDAESSIRTNYVQGGKVKVYFRYFPLSFHQFAMQAATAAACANDQGKFWEMHDTLFQNQATWSAATSVDSIFQSYAVAIGLNNATFTTCYNAKTHTAEINADEAEAQNYGVRGTPASFIIIPKSKISQTTLQAAVDGQNAVYGAGSISIYQDSSTYSVLIPGAFPYSAFDSILSKVSY